MTAAAKVVRVVYLMLMGKHSYVMRPRWPRGVPVTPELSTLVLYLPRERHVDCRNP
jgi:hypothetical protein